MKYSAVAVATFVGLVAAQLPGCAQPCIDAAVAKVTSCGADNACRCRPENKSAIRAEATTCVLSSCSDPIAVLTAAEAACANIPPPAPPASSVAASPPATSAAAPPAPPASEAPAAPAAPASSTVATPASSTAVTDTPYPTMTTSSKAEAAVPTGTGSVYPSVVPYVPGSSATTFGASSVFAVVMAVLAAL